ncbi:MAG: hypothetical protein Fues2KO_28470 [Fuerstiella sp.]
MPGNSELEFIALSAAGHLLDGRDASRQPGLEWIEPHWTCANALLKDHWMTGSRSRRPPWQTLNQEQAVMDCHPLVADETCMLNVQLPVYEPNSLRR